MIKPTGNRVVVEPVENDWDITETNLQLVRAKTVKPGTGKVVAVGPGTITTNGSQHPPRLQTGQIVVFNSTAGLKSTYNGKDIRILEERDILATLKS